jgi:outer membrane beta-barrel protein
MRSTVRRTAQTVLVAAAVVASFAGVSRAENPMLDDAPPTMRERPLLEGRHLIAPAFGVTINDPYARNLLAGINYRYHLNSWFGFGLDVWAGGSVRTALADDIERELSRPDRPFQLSASSLRALANLSVELVPLSGKAMLFSDALVHWDLHLMGGVGAAIVAGDGRIEDSVSLTPVFGVGMRFFFDRWLSLGFEIRDYLVNRAVSSRKDGSVPGSSFGHNWLFGLSIGFSFPTAPSFEE